MGLFDFLKKSGAVHSGGTAYTVNGGSNGPEYTNKDGKDVTDQVMSQELRNNNQEIETPSEVETSNGSGFSGPEEN